MKIRKKRYMIFPKGYDPMVADGPPEKFYENMVCSQPWTPEDTERMKEMEKQVTYSDEPPGTEFWFCDLEKNPILKE